MSTEIKYFYALAPNSAIYEGIMLLDGSKFLNPDNPWLPENLFRVLSECFPFSEASVRAVVDIRYTDEDVLSLMVRTGAIFAMSYAKVGALIMTRDGLLRNYMESTVYSSPEIIHVPGSDVYQYLGLCRRKLIFGGVPQPIPKLYGKYVGGKYAIPDDFGNTKYLPDTIRPLDVGEVLDKVLWLRDDGDVEYIVVPILPNSTACKVDKNFKVIACE